MGERVSALLKQSVEHLEDEVPASYRLILEKLGPMLVQVDVDGESFSLSGGQRLEISDGTVTGPGASISTSRAAILDVLDARVGLEEAVQAGTVCVQGSLDEILQAHDTLRAYVHAAIRASSQPGLLSALRAGTP
ncbi:MAG: SCP-2 sterol transfer family protein [Mycobacterium sp.]